ncbi:hypothetical protein HWB91_gp22 [Bacillus phage vB_BboS-125]|uniref:Uncharacterized protein n=1 Tax=Bacillus phage vB_BboS-125 TaxID=2419618 RepID=A0A3G3BVT5_9CAUD|nr:hypothetical protein HWB91_gp22 [Bacillus phage vB_BboS-125]AYP68392.1 hypothetical protein BboS125_00022 [Bacillus phage vB_BboS-125]
MLKVITKKEFNNLFQKELTTVYITDGKTEERYGQAHDTGEALVLIGKAKAAIKEAEGKRKKQTAGNNKFLAETKAQYSKGIYKEVLRLVNEGDEAAAKEYIRKMTTII